MATRNKLQTFTDPIEPASRPEWVWRNGYLNPGVTTHPTTRPACGHPPAQKLTIACGTATGNPQKPSSRLAAKAQQKAVHVKRQSIDQYRLHDLMQEEYFRAVTSTNGNGESPDAAKKNYARVPDNGINPEQLEYSALAVEDSCYPLFCKPGEGVGLQPNKLNDDRFARLSKCATDYHCPAGTGFTVQRF